ncbi:hypothetical protein HDU67_001479, partial [Dinochytrium kinnereticum]
MPCAGMHPRYLLPKAAQSLYTILIGEGLITHVPSSETFTACMSLGTLMMLYKTNPGSLVGVFVSILDFLVGKGDNVLVKAGKGEGR